MKFKFETVQNEKVLFKITPHTSVLNSMNRKLWHTIHEIMQLYESPMSRLSRKGLHFTYRIKDDIWWIVTIRSTPGAEEADCTKQIEFYICMSRTFSEVFLIKVKSHEQWRKCTVQEVPSSNIDFDLNNLDMYQLRYQRSNMFSLNHDHREHLTPIREIMHVSQEMKANDFVGMFMRMECVDRKRWKQIADYAWGVWNEGGIPRRTGFNPQQLFKGIKSIFLFVAEEVINIMESTLAAIENSVFHGSNSQPKRRKIETIDAERQELLINGTLSKQTRDKRNSPVFSTTINLAVGADSPARRDMLAYSVSSAFTELAADNKLELIKVNMHYGKEIKSFNVPSGRHLSNYMSTDEIGKLIQLPTSDVQEEFKDAIQANRNVEIDIPKVFLDDSGIYMGTATNRGVKHTITLPKKNPDRLMTSRVFIGSPGMGKDQSIINLIVEAKLKHGMGAVVVDVIDERNADRGMSDAIRDHLPVEDVIDLDIGEFDYPPYIGLAGALENPKNERIAISRITNELVQFVMGDDFENYQTREYLREMSKAVKCDLVLIKRMLTDPEYRKDVIIKLKAQGKDTELLDNYHDMGSARNIAGPIFVRLGELTGDEILRPIFCQSPNPAMQFKQWLHDGKVIIYRVPKKDMTDSTVRTLCYWIILNTYLTKLSLGGQGAMTWLVLNEPHQFLTKPLIDCFKRILLEGRKWRLAPIFAFHDFEVFREYPGFIDILKSAAINWHLFKSTNISMYQKIKAYLEPTFTPELAMESTKQFQYIAKWLDDEGMYQPAFIMSAPKMVGDRYPTQNNEFLTKRHSRMYGRHIDEITQEISAKSRRNAT